MSSFKLEPICSMASVNPAITVNVSCAPASSSSALPSSSAGHFHTDNPAADLNINAGGEERKRPRRQLQSQTRDDDGDSDWEGNREAGSEMSSAPSFNTKRKSQTPKTGSASALGSAGKRGKHSSPTGTLTPTSSLAGDGDLMGSSGEIQPAEPDKRQRREIANSNERRRMQCINNGFGSLQQILPKNYLKRGEKMSKAAILQSTVDYIKKLETENSGLQSKNEGLTKKLAEEKSVKPESRQSATESDEGISVLEESSLSSSAKDLVSMVQHWREQCDRERTVRAQTEETLRRLLLEMQYCPASCFKRLTNDPTIYAVAKAQPEDSTLLNQNLLFSSHQHILPVGSSTMTVEEYLHAIGASSSQFLLPVPFSNVPQQQMKQEPCSSSSEEVAVKGSRSNSSFNSASVSPMSPPQEEEDDEEDRSQLEAKFVPPTNSRQKPAKTMSGFDILFEAISYSEHNSGWDSNLSDSGCSEETIESQNQNHRGTDGGPPLKKRRKNLNNIGRL